MGAGILYHDMYASDLVGTHVEMRSLEVSTPVQTTLPLLHTALACATWNLVPRVADLISTYKLVLLFTGHVGVYIPAVQTLNP